MKNGQRPSRHVRIVQTRNGRKPTVVNPYIPKRPEYQTISPAVRDYYVDEMNLRDKEWGKRAVSAAYAESKILESQLGGSARVILDEYNEDKREIMLSAFGEEQNGKRPLLRKVTKRVN